MAKKATRSHSARSKASPEVAVKAGAAVATDASQLIDQRIRDLAASDAAWRSQTLARVRALILEAAPEIVEEWKWNNPVWARPANGRTGIVCTGEAYAKTVKLTFAQGASVPDPTGLFNASLEGNTRRAIDIREGQAIDARAFKALIKAAVAQIGESDAASSTKQRPGAAGGKKAGKAETKHAKPAEPSKVVLLSGGNPQIAKADGDAPVQAYIAAMPGWKKDLGKRLDAIIVRNVPKPPGVRKAVRWNSPFYGLENYPDDESQDTPAHAPARGWFLSFHVFTRYVKVTFFAGTSLDPVPPGGTPKSKEVRWIDIHEDDDFDEAQFASWVKQAAAVPGWVP